MNHSVSADALRSFSAPTSDALRFAMDQLSLTRELREKVAAQEWKQVNNIAASCAGRGYAAVQLLLEETEAAEASDRYMHRTRAAYRNALQQVLSGPRREDILEASRDVAVPLGSDAPQVQTFIEAFQQGNVDLLVDQLFEPRQRTSRFADRAIVASVSLLSIGLQGRLQAEFNETYASAGTHSETSSLRFLEGLKDERGRIATLLRERQLALYEAALEHSSHQTIQDAALALARTIEVSLPSLVRVQALVAGSKAISRSSEIGLAATVSGQLTREALSAHAAAYSIACRCAHGTPSQSLPRLIRDVTRMQFDMSIPDGRNTALRDLSTTRDEQYVEVQGYVSKIEVVREQRDGKLLTFLYMTDKAGQHETRVEAIYTHLPHRGLTAGSYCRLSGTFRKQSRLRRNFPSIEIEKLALAEEETRSWRLALLQAGKPWFETWPNGLNMEWSLGAHQPTHPEDDQHLGAGEFLTRKPLPTQARKR